MNNDDNEAMIISWQINKDNNKMKMMKQKLFRELERHTVRISLELYRLSNVELYDYKAQ